MASVLVVITLTTENTKAVSGETNEEIALNSSENETPNTVEAAESTKCSPCISESAKSQCKNDNDISANATTTTTTTRVENESEDTKPPPEWDLDDKSELLQTRENTETESNEPKNFTPIEICKDLEDEKNVNFKTGSDETEGNLTDYCSSQRAAFDQQFSIFFDEIQLTAELVAETLSTLKVENVVWKSSDDRRYQQASFIVDDGQKCEDVLQTLHNIGVGIINKSSITMFPASLHVVSADTLPESDQGGTDDKNDSQSSSEESDFKKSIKSRLLVAQVVSSVEANAKFTFDYIMLIILASIIAGMGLVENSSIVLVASMLISPLMGPILAGTFGTVINNEELRNTGIKNEVIGLGICVICGFLFGIVSGIPGLSGATWGSTLEWPTGEMKSRGMTHSLWVGIMIALPSGAGVALSVLGGNAGSLVGVAISASLLPPAVNAGVLWMFSILSSVVPPVVIQNGTLTSELGCLPFVNNEYEPVYSCTMAVEALVLGLVSLSLTILNILCIFIMGILVLKLKEVAPHTAKSPEMESFWRNDIEVARQSYKTTKGAQSVSLGKQFLEEYKKLNRVESDLATAEFQNILHNIEEDKNVTKVLQRLPLSPLSVEKDVAEIWRKTWGREDTPKSADVYYTVKYRPDQPTSPRVVYKTIHNVGPRFNYDRYHHVTHRILKRAKEVDKPEKNLKLLIPQVQVRKPSDASSARSFLITKVPESTGGTDSTDMVNIGELNTVIDDDVSAKSNLVDSVS